MNARARYPLWFVFPFLTSWLGASGVQWWNTRPEAWIYDSCKTSLTLLLQAEQRVCAKNVPHEVGLMDVKRDLAARSWGIALLCAKDPDFQVKLLMTKSPNLDYEPSYEWHPVDRVIAACPYHELAIDRSGTFLRWKRNTR